MNTKILCVDFDGVLHSYESGWQGASVIADGPVPGAMQFIQDIVNVDGYKLCVYSSRSKDPEGVLAMRRWLFDHLVLDLHRREDIPRDRAEAMASTLVDHIDFPKQKPAAYLTIDDRAICFRSTFPSILEMDHFKAWNKG